MLGRSLGPAALAIVVGAAGGCAPLLVSARPEAVGGGAEASVSAAMATVSMASASASLRLLEREMNIARVLSRDGVGEDPVPGGARQLVYAAAPVETEDTPPIVEPLAGVAPGRRLDARGPNERWAVPVRDPRVTSRFGPRVDPITGEVGRMHRGVDFGAPTGEPVFATASGTIVLGGYCDRGTGNCVVIDHAGGWRSQYFHLSRVSVRPGEQVAQGDEIGRVGSTGRSTGPHLHFQLGREGVAVDPEEYFGARVD